MYSLADTVFESNKYLKMNFDGGDLSSDSGLLLIKEFISKMGFDNLLSQQFHTTDSTTSRFHKDDANLLQVIYQVISAYFEDDRADTLTNDPVFKAILGKDALASQPTLSRFYNRMNNDTLTQFGDIARALRKRVYSCKKPQMILMDLDSTLLETYGKQEGEGFNFHYRAHGYHPLVCYDSLTGDLLKIQLRRGTDYCSTGVEEFMRPLLDEYQSDYSSVKLFLRGDSGFATPGLYTQCETNGVSYAIRLKENATLRKLAEDLDTQLNEMTKSNMVDYAVVYGEFLYQAGSWDYPRRVVCKIEKHTGQIVHMNAFIVTNMSLTPEQAIRFYSNRGSMENLIKEGKTGFDFAAVSSHSEVVNASRLQIRALAYNIFNWFKRLVLPKNLCRSMVDTIRLKLLKIAARVIRSARYITFKLCSSCPYKREFFETLENIKRLRPLLE
jgi:putative NIF3 family GTP cyclohydrolase 1 type 2